MTEEERKEEIGPSVKPDERLVSYLDRGLEPGQEMLELKSLWAAVRKMVSAGFRKGEAPAGK